MEMRPYGRTGISLPVLGVGAQRICDEEGVCEAEAVELLNMALDRGVRYFDTAWAYSVPRSAGGVYRDGQSEQRIGLVAKHRRGEMWIATKWGENTRDGAWRQLEESLTHLQTDHVDEWRLHCLRSFKRLDEVTAKGGALEAAQEAKEQGIARNIGFSTHGDPQVAVEALRRFPFDTVLAPVCATDHFAYSYASELLPVAAQRRVGVMGMKVLGLGELATVAALAIRYALGLPLTGIILGCRSIAELEFDCASAETYAPLSPDERCTLFRAALPLVKPEVMRWDAVDFDSPHEWRRRREPGGLTLLANLGGLSDEIADKHRICTDYEQ